MNATACKHDGHRYSDLGPHGTRKMCGLCGEPVPREAPTLHLVTEEPLRTVDVRPVAQTAPSSSMPCSGVEAIVAEMNARLLVLDAKIAEADVARDEATKIRRMLWALEES